MIRKTGMNLGIGLVKICQKHYSSFNQTCRSTSDDLLSPATLSGMPILVSVCGWVVAMVSPGNAASVTTQWYVASSDVWTSEKYRLPPLDTKKCLFNTDRRNELPFIHWYLRSAMQCVNNRIVQILFFKLIFVFQVNAINRCWLILIFN